MRSPGDHTFPVRSRCGDRTRDVDDDVDADADGAAVAHTKSAPGAPVLSVMSVALDARRRVDTVGRSAKDQGERVTRSVKLASLFVGAWPMYQPVAPG